MGMHCKIRPPGTLGTGWSHVPDPEHVDHAHRPRLEPDLSVPGADALAPTVVTASKWELREVG